MAVAIWHPRTQYAAMAYAENTTVPVERTKAEIESQLRRHGADQFFSGWTADEAFVSFRAHDRYVRFKLPLPKRDDKRFTKRATKYSSVDRGPSEAEKLWEQAIRAKWRALMLTVKAKLESIDAGIETFEQAFLSHIVLPDQTLVGDRVIAIVGEAYRTGKTHLLAAPVATEDAATIDDDG